MDGNDLSRTIWIEFLKKYLLQYTYDLLWCYNERIENRRQTPFFPINKPNIPLSANPPPPIPPHPPSPLTCRRGVVIASPTLLSRSCLKNPIHILLNVIFRTHRDMFLPLLSLRRRPFSKVSRYRCHGGTPFFALCGEYRL